MKKVKLSLLALLATVATSVSAQNVITVESDSGRVETIELPEGMLVSEEELMQDYTNKTNLTEGTANVRDLSASDSLIISRLSRIPTTIEMPLNDVTRKFIDKWIERKGSVSVMLGAMNFYGPIFEEALDRYGLPLELRYLPVIESGLRPQSTSNVGAAGLWQFMLETGKGYGLNVNTLVDERLDAYKASDAAARCLSAQYNKFNDWGLAIAAYNCGAGNVQKAITRSGKSKEEADYWSVYNYLPKETRGYVPAFIGATYIMNYYCEHGIVPREATQLPEEADTVMVHHEMTFKSIASKCGISVERLRSINPQYRRDIVPNGATLCLPQEFVEDYILFEDSITRSAGITKSEVRRAVIDDVDSDSSKSKKDKESASSRKEDKSKSKKDEEEELQVVSLDAQQNSAQQSDDADEKAEKERARKEKELQRKKEKEERAKKEKEERAKKEKEEKRKKEKEKARKEREERKKPKSVEIKSGDTLIGLAKKHGTTVENLKKLNGLKDDNIRAGKTLRLK